MRFKCPPLMPCRRCGRFPKLRRCFASDDGHDGQSLYAFWFECSRWFGLQFCQRAAEHMIEKTWADLGRQQAALKWNEQQETPMSERPSS